MKYFPLREPLSDIQITGASRQFLTITFFINGEARGQVRVHHSELADFLNLICEATPVAEYDSLFDSGTEWFRDYDKDHVVSEDGVIVHKDDVP